MAASSPASPAERRHRRLLSAATGLLRCLPPETAHEAAIRGLAFTPRLPLVVPTGLATRLAGLDLVHPLGLAGGFDKDARAIGGLLRLGFAFVEAGTVTPLPQPGNPRPRLFRLARDEALINRLGFNNGGLDAFASRLSGRLAGRPRGGIVGANVGANAKSLDRISDYALGAARVLPLADYLTINVSSPNTAGLRDLQEREALRLLLAAVTGARKEAGATKPIFLKVAPDLDPAAADAIVEAAVEAGIDGIIATNTTIARPAGLRSAAKGEAGGLSGRPLLEPSTGLLARMARRARGRLAFIGVGGISTGADAYAKITHGATALQLYTAFVYQGPAVIQRVLDELASCLDRDGFASIDRARGTAL